MMNLRALWPVAAVVVAAVAVWPAFVNGGIDESQIASASAPAPVNRDYEQRDQLVAFWEGAVRERHVNDMLSPRQLAGQYLQRYRERGDIDDVIRAQRMAQRSLAVTPRNVAALDEMASIKLTLHRFRDALAYVDELLPFDPTNAAFLAKRASLEMEVGDYAAADAALRRVRSADLAGADIATVRARYDELTGKLARARELLAGATAQVDGSADEPAQARAWYHVRTGELAFEAGDDNAAIAAENDALAIFPTDNLALKDLAKFELARHHYHEALAAATKGGDVTPFAETLGYKADAQAALGDARAAAITRQTIFAIEQLGNAYHVNDRLLAVYYADHRLRVEDAVAIAQREANVRGDEIYAQDTLAWAAAVDGRWDLARRADVKAMRLGIQDPIVRYHAGIIAMHFGQRQAARRYFAEALAANPNFQPTFAADARKRLAKLAAQHF